MSGRSHRALIWTALGLALVYVMAYVVLLGFVPPPAPRLPAERVVALYAQANIRFRIGVVLMILSGAFFLPFAAVLSAQMAPLEPGFPVWAWLQGLASTLGTWLFAFPPVLWGVAAFSAGRDPALTVLMHELGWLVLVSPTSFFTFQLLPVIVIALRRGERSPVDPFPRWLGYLTVLCVLAGDVGALAQLFDHGPFAWNGLFSFYLAILVFSIWFGATARRLYQAAGLHAR